MKLWQIKSNQADGVSSRKYNYSAQIDAILFPPDQYAGGRKPVLSIGVGSSAVEVYAEFTFLGCNGDDKPEFMGG